MMPRLSELPNFTRFHFKEHMRYDWSAAFILGPEYPILSRLYRRESASKVGRRARSEEARANRESTSGREQAKQQIVRTYACASPWQLGQAFGK